MMAVRTREAYPSIAEGVQAHAVIVKTEGARA